MTNTQPRQVPVAVVGIGALLPGSSDAGGFWRAVVAGRDLITDVPSSRWLIEDHYDADPSAPDKTYARRGAFLPEVAFDPLAYGVPPKALPATDSAQLLALMVAEEVLGDAGGLTKMNRDRVSVILGAAAMELLVQMNARLQRPVWLKALRDNGIPEAEAQAVCESIAGHYPPWQESSFPGLLGNVVAGRIANRFDLHGTNHITDAACASSFAALSTAVSELSLGRADMVISGGVDTANDVLMFTCFSKTPALSPTGDCRPFSDMADGTMLGEGIAMYALKRLQDAERDGDQIYAVIRGIGTASDGKSTAIYAPLPEGQARALRRTYEDAGYSPGTVELVEAHGTGTSAGDAAEFAALRQVFEDSGRVDRQWCAIGSVKSQIGHTKCAAGAAGLLKTILALHHKVLPPTIKVDRPNPTMEFGASPFYVNTQMRPWVRSADHPRRASVSSFGFGGSNFHVTLEEYQPTHRPEQRGGRAPSRIRTAPTELVLFSGPSPAPLLERKIDSDRPLAEIARESQTAFRTDEAMRLAIIASDTDDLSAKLAQAATLIRNRPKTAFSTPTGIHYAIGAPSVGRIGFLFPGQGTQYVGMGAAVSMLSPAAQAVWDRLGSVEFDGHPLHRAVFPPPAFTADDRAAQQAQLTATEWAQPALAAHSLALLEVMRGLGIQPDCVAGHSFGELIALHAAGVLDAESLVRLSRRRGELMRQSATTPGAMLAVMASRSEIEAAVTSSGCTDVWLANHNAPSQVVVAGASSAIDVVEQQLAADGVVTRRLDTATAFHSPVVDSASAPLLTFLHDVAISAPQLAVYGNSDALAYPSSPEEIRRRIAEHLASPVLFSDQIEAMYDAGVRTFVEVGAGATLTGLVGQILGERAHLAVSLDRKGQDGVTTLHDALGQLAVHGLELNHEDQWMPFASLDTTPKENKPKMTVKLDGANYGQLYPPAGGAAALPAPNPPRQQIEPRTPTVPDVTAPVTAAPHAQSSDAQWIAMLESAQRHTAEAHEACHRMLIDSHMAFLQMTETTFAAMLGPRPDSIAPVGATAPSVLPPPPTIRPTPMVPPAGHEVTLPPSDAPVPATVPVVQPAPPGEPSPTFPELLLSVVAERTGYPASMLNLDMDLETDLGVDSIKRVEILSAVRSRVELPDGDVSGLMQLRTMREVVDAFTTGADISPVAEPIAPQGHPEARHQAAEPTQVNRLTVRALNAPAPGLAMAGLGAGPITVTDDGSGIAALVAAKLTDHGIRATVSNTVPEDTYGVVHLGGLAQIGSINEALGAQRHAFQVAQSVASRFAAQGGLFVTVQDTGGDFGLGGTQPDRAWLGGISALTRTTAKEWPTAAIKAIDCERGGRDPNAIAEAIVSELLHGGPATDVGLRADGTRTIMSADPAPAVPGAKGGSIGPESLIVATGGARGVTAAALLHLARTRQPRIVLVGRTELAAEPVGLPASIDEAALTRALAERSSHASPAAITAQARKILAAREVRSTLAALEAAGSPVRYVSADVRDSEALSAALDEVREDWGPITGIVHGAGVLADKLLADKSEDQFDEVMTTKVGGLRALLAATTADPLEVIVLFSSVAATYGNAGQSDYAIANEVLNHVASAEAAQRPECLVRSIGWGPWDGGMVTPALAEHFGRSGVALIPIEQGAAVFTAELSLQGADARVVITAGNGLCSIAVSEEPVAAQVRFDSHSHPYLADHNIAGVPVLPLAMALNSFVAAATAWRPGAGAVLIRDLRVFSKVALPHLDSGGHQLMLRGRRTMTGAPSAVDAELVGADGTLHYGATLEPQASAAPVSARWDAPARLIPVQRSRIYDGRVLFHRPRFQAIRSIHGICADGAEATVTGLHELGWGGDNWQLDPAAVDGGLQLAVLWAEGLLGGPSLPMAVAECRVHRRGQIDSTVRCVVRARETRDTGARCDLALIDADGTPRVELFGVELVLRPS